MVPVTGAELLFLLLVGHALADYPLQGQFLAQGKNRHTDLGRDIWPHALAAHAMIHGGLVTLLTGSAVLGLAETAIHAATDWLKCEGKISFNVDQAIHIACKVVWFTLVTLWMT